MKNEGSMNEHTVHGGSDSVAQEVRGVGVVCWCSRECSDAWLTGRMTAAGREAIRIAAAIERGEAGVSRFPSSNDA